MSSPCALRPWPRLAATLLCVALAAGCATKQPDGDTAAPQPRAPADGKYYKDDGPPAVDEVDWRTVPDAVPEFKQIPSTFNRPYEVFGVKYIPFTGYTRYLKRGMASWYGKRYHGRKTSTGEVYDMYGMTAAHTVLPIPSYARVTRVDDGRSIIVRVNDRGPFLNERVIDLSYVAARKLGVVESGTAEVIVEALLPPAAENAPARAAVPEEGSVFLQLGAYSREEGAVSRADSIKLPAGITVRSLEVAQGDDGLHRLLLGPYADEQATARDRNLLEAEGFQTLVRTWP